MLFHRLITITDMCPWLVMHLYIHRKLCSLEKETYHNFWRPEDSWGGYFRLRFLVIFHTTGWGEAIKWLVYTEPCQINLNSCGNRPFVCDDCLIFRRELIITIFLLDGRRCKNFIIKFELQRKLKARVGIIHLLVSGYVSRHVT